MRIATTTQKTVYLSPAEVAQAAGLDTPESWAYPDGSQEVSFTVARDES